MKRKALLTSVLALLLCVSMLVGTTFAWFTDSVSNGVNKIVSGNLDVELWHIDYVNGDYPDGFEPVEADTPLFLNQDKEEILWEPGAGAAEDFQIKNVGSLALKYQFSINFANATETPEGKTLADILDVTIYQIGGNFTDEQFKNPVDGTIISEENAGLKDCVIEGYLLPGEDIRFTTIINWNPSDIDNEFNVKGGLSIDLGVNLVATQYTYEKDATGDQYDANATYPIVIKADVWDGTEDFSLFGLSRNPSENEVANYAPNQGAEYVINTAEELAAFARLVDAGKTFEGTTVLLNADLDLYCEDDNGEAICFDPIGSYRYETSFKGTFDGQGHTIKNLTQNTWALDNGYYYTDCGLGLFGAIEEGTVKDLTLDGVEVSGESAICGAVAAYAYNATFENITVKNSNVADYQYYAGGIMGWASGTINVVGCNIDESTNVAAQWGDFDNSIGGVIGGAGGSANITIKDTTVACRIDAYNDVTSSYQWYAYRRAGMLIGNTGKTTTNTEGTTIADAPQLTCENVTVIYGEWANYTYCEFAGTSWPYVRVQSGVSNSAYSNPRYGHPTDANGNEVVDDSHVHNAGEDHFVECTFDQLYGGGQGVYGKPDHDGVTVIYNNH